MLLLLALLAVAGGGSAATYKLQKVTSVQAGGLYVFEQGGRVMGSTIKSSALQTTATYSTTGLAGTEAYVWTLEAGTSDTNSGFYMRNVSKSSSFYLCNTSGTNLSFGAETSRSLWQFNFQSDETVLIQNLNNNDRFLGYTGETSYAYKAYATSNIDGGYPHAVVVYQLVEETGGGEDPTPVDATWSVSPASVTVTAGETATAEITTNYNGALSVSTDDANVATATLSGKTLTVTGVAEGTATLTISGAATTAYNAVSETVSVSVSAAPAVTEQWVETPITALTSSDVFLIVDKTSEKALPSTETSSAPSAVGVRFNDDKTEVIGAVDNGLKWYFEDSSGAYVFHAYGDPNSVLYLNNDNNGVRINNDWSDASRPEFVYDSDAQKLKTQLPWNDTYRWIGVYSSQDWRCYTSTATNIKNTVTAFYKRVDISGKERTTTTFAESAYTFDQGSTEAAAFTGQTATVKDNAGAVMEGATVTYASNNTGVAAVDAATGLVTLGTAAGTATITATYAGDDTHVESSASYTITVEAVVDGIAAFKALAKNTSTKLRLTNAQVLYVNNKDMYVRDASGAIDFYNTGLSYTAGQQLNGMLTAKYTLYNGLPELTTPISDNTLVATDGTAVPVEIAVADAANYYCDLVKLSGVSTTDIAIYDKFSIGYGTLDATKTYNVVGILIPYNGSPQICPIEAPEVIIVEGEVDAPTFSIASGTAVRAGTTLELTQDAAMLILYTTDGSDPSWENGVGEVYAGAITITEDVTIKAIAVDEEEAESPVATAHYTILPVTVPTFSPAGGAVAAGTEVTITAGEEAEMVLYTTDGTDPDFETDNGEIYDGATTIVITEDMTLKAVAYDSYSHASAVATATYTIAVPAIGEGTGKFRKITSAEELTDGRYLIVYEAGSLAMDGARNNGEAGSMDAVSNTIAVTIESDVIEGAEAAAFTYDATAKTLRGEGGLYIGQTSNANGLASSATTAYTNTISFDNSGNANIVSGGAYLRYNATNTQTRFRYFKSSSYAAQKPVALYKEIKTVPVTIGSTGYATLYYGTVALTVPEGVTAYTYKVDGDAMVESATIEAGGTIPAGEGVVLYTETPDKYDFELTTGGEKDSENMLFGTDEATAINAAGYLYYQLSRAAGNTGEVGFYYQTTDGKSINNGAHKAYLRIAETQAAGIRGFVLPGAQTGVALTTARQLEGQTVYDLQGRRTAATSKGLYIVNGKKVMVK